MMLPLLLLLALVAGAGLSVQAVLNAHIARALGHPLWGTGVSLLVSLAVMVPLVLLLRLPVPEAASFARPRWWFWLGGIIGVVYLTVSLVLAPRIGVAAMIAAVVAGQMLASLLLDHFGWLGLAREPATPWRLLGALLIILGVVLIRNPLRPPDRPPQPALSAVVLEAPPARTAPAGARRPD